MPPKVLVDIANREGIRAEDWRRFTSVVEPVEIERQEPYAEDELIESLQGIQGLMKLGRRVPEITRRVFAQAPDLQIVGIGTDRFGTGVDLEAATEHGVKVVDTDNIASSGPVAEWDLAMMLLCLRNAGAVYRQMMEGSEQWAIAQNADFVNGELTGRRVGLVGCGHVGQRLVELLAPFRVDLKVYDPYLAEEEVERLGLVRDTLEAVIHHAEILVVQVPLTPKTRGLIGGRELGLLRRGAILINCSRGPVVDQQALIRRLQARELIAGLDVFDPEPLEKNSPLRALPNAFITPHIAWYAPNVLHRYFSSVAEEFGRFFRGETLRYELTLRMVDIRWGRI